MLIRRCFRFSSSSTSSEDDKNLKKHLTKFQFIKLLTSLTLPLAVGIFTIVTTIQNRKIAEKNREQDLTQAEDEQRQNFFVNYINDVSRYRDKNYENLTNNPNKLLYIRTKTLTILRKLDNERKKHVLLFLKESSLLSEDNERSLLIEANFNGIELIQNDCIFKDVSFVGVYFKQVSFINCVFNNVTFRYVNFHRAILTNCVFYLTHFINCQMDYVNFQGTIISESDFNHTLLSYIDFRTMKLDYVKFNNVNFTKSNFSTNFIEMKNIKIYNSLLPSGAFSQVDDIHIYSNFCISFDQGSSRLTNGIDIKNCTLVTNVENAGIVYEIVLPFADRSVLIDAGQAEFIFQLTQKHPMKFVSINIYYIGVENGIFETHQVDCLSNTNLTCQHRLRILPSARVALVKINFISIGTTVDRINYSVKRLNSNVL